MTEGFRKAIGGQDPPLGENVVESSLNVMAHGDALEGKWRGNWRIDWVASTLYTTSEHGVSSITTTDAHTSAASSRLKWRPSDLNWLVRFAERWSLVSARAPSHFKRSLTSPRGTSGCFWIYRWNILKIVLAYRNKNTSSLESCPESSFWLWRLMDLFKHYCQ